MQEADEQKLLIFLPGEEIPADEIFRLPAQFAAKGRKDPLRSGRVRPDVPEG